MIIFSLECNLPLARLAFDYLKSHIMNIGELLYFVFPLHPFLSGSFSYSQL